MRRHSCMYPWHLHRRCRTSPHGAAAEATCAAPTSGSTTTLSKRRVSFPPAPGTKTGEELWKVTDTLTRAHLHRAVATRQTSASEVPLKQASTPENRHGRKRAATQHLVAGLHSPCPSQSRNTSFSGSQTSSQITRNCKGRWMLISSSGSTALASPLRALGQDTFLNVEMFVFIDIHGAGQRVFNVVRTCNTFAGQHSF